MSRALNVLAFRRANFHGDKGEPNYPHPIGGNGDAKVPDSQKECSHCFDNSARLLLSIDHKKADAENYKLVHANVTNIEGRSFPHGWVEHDLADSTTEVIDSARDTKNPIKMEASKFRGLLQAKDITEYSQEQAAIKLARSGHFGPWGVGNE